MIIAQKQRRENICEYLLYMWQVEDLIRAAECNTDKIDELILNRYSFADEDTKAEVRKWYYELAEMMRSEGKLLVGHLDINRVVMMNLEDLHRRLLANEKEYIYTSLHYQVLPALVQLRAKQKESGSDPTTEVSDIETCFNAIYGYLTLKLKGQEVYDDTLKSIKQISTFLAMLAHKFKQDEEGSLEQEYAES